MSEQIHPPLPDITDGEAGVNHLMVDAFLDPAIGLRLSIQVEGDGSYRISVLRIGADVRGIHVFAKRDQVERLHRLLGRHLEQLDAYDRLLNGPAAAPDPDATIAEAFAARKVATEEARRESEASESAEEIRADRLREGEEGEAVDDEIHAPRLPRDEEIPS